MAGDLKQRSVNFLRFFAYTESTHVESKRQNQRLAQVIILIFTTGVFFFGHLQIATAQTVHIPNPSLRTVIEAALGKEAGEDITQADMASLKDLDAVKSGIRDLTGLEFATNLTKLELGINRVSDVSPLKDLINLTKLRLGANGKIPDLSPLKGLINLTFLDLDSNGISDVSPLKDLTNLTWLDLDDNQIADLSPLKGLINLTFLDLDNNQISDVSPLKDLTKLTWLDVGDNEISDVSSLSILTNLTVLDLEGIKTSDVSALSTLINLTELDLHNNEISDVSPLSGLVNLMELDLQDNEISDVSPLKDLTNLTVLNLRGNQISDFSPIAGLIENLVEYYTDGSTDETDVNRDGVVNVVDLILVALYYRDPNFAAAASFDIYPDVNKDGVVDVEDLIAVAAEIDAAAAAPRLRKNPAKVSNLTAERLTQWIALAKQLDTQEPHTLKGITVLKQLLAVLTSTEVLPKETALLANYPNPFNPETWIPCQLSKATEVNITIYAADGKLIRSLELGYLSSGVYRSKSRAAYWNGCNELGESVASGVYFYTLTAGNFAATRKMLIRK